MTKMAQDYQEALSLLEQAKSILEKIGRENQTEWDSDRYAYEVGQVISCDDGEAGLKPYVDSMS